MRSHTSVSESANGIEQTARAFLYTPPSTPSCPRAHPPQYFLFLVLGSQGEVQQWAGPRGRA